MGVTSESSFDILRYGDENVCRMWPKLRTFKPTSALSGMALTKSVRVRRDEAGTIGYLRQMPDGRRRIKRSLERRAHPP